MNDLSFFVPGLPKAQPRAKATTLGRFASVYTPKTADVWKAGIVTAARYAWNQFDPLDSALVVRMDFRLPRPRAHYGAKGLKPSAPQWHDKKPDLDNLAKAVLDAITNSGIWTDDAIVCELTVSKRYTPTNESGVLVVIYEAEDRELGKGMGAEE